MLIGSLLQLDGQNPKSNPDRNQSFKLESSSSEFQAELGELVFGRLLLVRPTFLLLILPVLMRGDAALMC